jgi:hypothetical protein
MQKAQQERRPLFPPLARQQSNGSYKPPAADRNQRRLAPSQFDLVITFEDDAQAREALLALRREHFGPDQAVLLTRGPLARDEYELAEEELRAESVAALGITIGTEVVLGAFVGAIVGWLAGLFWFAPQVGPVWIPILIVALIGALCGGAVGFVEFRRWQTHQPGGGEAAIALRLRGATAPARLERAQRVLADYGGQQETG